MGDIVLAGNQVDRMSRQMVGLVLTFLDERKGMIKTQEQMHDLCAQFMMHFIGALVFQALKDRPKGGSKKQVDLLDHNYRSFAGVKMKIQDAVANGVQDAMTAYSGHPIEYFCDIRPVPEPINKKEV